MPKLVQFIQSNRQLLAFGFLLTFLSSFGQTFLISLYLPFIQETFNLTDGGFSMIYGSATIASAFTITWLGSYIDKIRLTRFSLFVLLALSVSLIIFSQTYYIPVLFIAFYGLRLFGQGLLSHTAVTSMARFFDDKTRGKAISFANLGHSFGEAFLPIVIVTLLIAIGWRYTVLITLIFTLLAIPYSLYLLRKNSNIGQLRKYIPQPFTKEEQKQARPLQIIRTRAFWILIPSSLVAASIGTGFLLFKLKMGISKGWDPTFIAAGFTLYAVGNAVSNIVAGFLSDKFGGKALFPIYLLPFCLGLLTYIFADGPWVYLVLIAGIGITNGFGGTIKSVVIAELFGTKIIGSVRSLFVMIMVFSTALGPLLFGSLLDAGYSFEFIAGISLIAFALCTVNSLRILAGNNKVIS
jgi:MFS family permease